MRFSVLGTGSSGNAVFASSGDGGLLIDAGFSVRELVRRMEAVGEEPESVQGILVSHEHTDHVSGLGRFCRRYGCSFYATPATLDRVPGLKGKEECIPIEAGSSFCVGPFEVHPFSVSHDAADPVGYLLKENGISLVVATDLGTVTRLVAERLKDATAVVLESNHDVEMLREGPYPWHLKQRILSSQGHLSNETAAHLLREVASRNLQVVTLAHLSRKNNDPDLAHFAASKALSEAGLEDVQLQVGCQDRPSPVFQLEP